LPGLEPQDTVRGSAARVACEGASLTVVLGINAYHSNASAALLVDGDLVAAVEEERFTRQKYETGFPHRSIRYCLDAGGVSPGDVDHVALAGNPLANFPRKAWFALGTPSGRRLVRRRGEPLAQMRVKSVMAQGLGVGTRSLRARVHRVEHHVAHIASAYFVSPFERAAVASFDGFGDMVSAMWGLGEGNRLRIDGEVNFPHSLGMFYLGFTQYLGFDQYGDEYKVMGLASYGEPEFLDEMAEVLRYRGGLRFELDMRYFRHGREIQPMVWRGGPARLGPVWDEGLVRRFGPVRSGAEEPIEERHRNVACSMQRRLEEVELAMLRSLRQRTGESALCLAGGVALNCVVNGKIRSETGFDELFVQPAAYDGGTSLGAAAHVYHHVLGFPRSYVMDHAYLGPEFDEARCRRALEEGGLTYLPLDDDELIERTAGALAEGRIVGWFQGRMEFGPRALGNRSILADPRREELKDVLNARIKRREAFRPFAPSILEECSGDWFEDGHPSPFMLVTCDVKRDRRHEIPAPTHVDGTSRIQTVRQDQNPRYHRLIRAFGRRTGVPMLLNTSFNESEPICCTPEEAVETFRRTRMDALVLGSLYVEGGTSRGGSGTGGGRAP
jgi:carbamoyltransferase